MQEIIRPESGTPGYYDIGGIDPNTYFNMTHGRRTDLTAAEAYLLGQLTKYTSRYKLKEGSDDGEKILYYAELLAALSQEVSDISKISLKPEFVPKEKPVRRLNLLRSMKTALKNWVTKLTRVSR